MTRLTARRAAIARAHRAFDDCWRTGLTTRAAAYRWLARALDLPSHRAHFGLLTIEQCELVLEKLPHWRDVLERRRDRHEAKAARNT